MRHRPNDEFRTPRGDIGHVIFDRRLETDHLQNPDTRRRFEGVPTPRIFREPRPDSPKMGGPVNGRPP